MPDTTPTVIISNLAPVGTAEALFFSQLVEAFREAEWTPYVWSIQNSAYKDCWIPLSWTINRWPQPDRALPSEELNMAYSLIDKEKWLCRISKLVKQYCDPVSEAENLLDIVVAKSWEILSRYDPSLVLSWNTLCPHTGILHDMCITRGIPTMLIERAFFPDTWFIEKGGLLGHSILAHKTLSELIPSSEFSKRVVDGKQIIDSLVTNSYVKYTQQQSDAFSALQNHPLASKPRIVFFPPDDGTLGFFPVDGPDRKATIPGYQSSFEATCKLAEHHDGLVVFKPHPSFIDWEFDDQEHDNLVVLDHDFRDLLQWADIIASTGSGLTFLALNDNKPVISMAIDILYGKDIVYEALHAENIVSALDTAVRRDDSSERIRNYQAYVSYLMSDYLVSLSDTTHENRLTTHKAVKQLLASEVMFAQPGGRHSVAAVALTEQRLQQAKLANRRVEYLKSTDDSER
jgi:hypothetical protein